MLGPSSYPKSVNSQVNFITPCNSCDICKHYLLAEKKFTSKVTGKIYFIKGDRQKFHHRTHIQRGQSKGSSRNITFLNITIVTLFEFHISSVTSHFFSSTITNSEVVNYTSTEVY